MFLDKKDVYLCFMVYLQNNRQQGRRHLFKSGGARSEKNVAHHGWATKKILKISSS